MNRRYDLLCSNLHAAVVLDHAAECHLGLFRTGSISKLEFIPLLDGTYTSLSRGVVWLSIDKTALRGFKKVYPKLRIVNPDLINISDIENVTEMLVKLGVRCFSLDDVLELVILPCICDGVESREYGPGRPTHTIMGLTTVMDLRPYGLRSRPPGLTGSGYWQSDRNDTREKGRDLLEVIDSLWVEYFSDKTHSRIGSLPLMLLADMRYTLSYRFAMDGKSGSIDEGCHMRYHTISPIMCDGVPWLVLVWMINFTFRKSKVFGDRAPYAIPKVNSVKLANYIGLKSTATLDDALSVLELWRQSENFKA
ncbi:hypothetical protein Tco_1019088, partial [Tanacetum coccineum]